MTLEQLRIFVAVAERQHMTRAAEALGLVQSAVSAAVAALEARHATVLFHRVGRRIELTEAGRVFLPEARAVLARAAAAELALAETSGLARGSLTVAASQTIAGYWLPARLVEFRRAHPQVAVRLVVGNTAQVAAAVVDGDADVGLVEGAIDVPALSDRPFPGDRLILVVPPGHAFADRAAIAPADLLDADVILREPGSGTRSEFEEALRAAGVDPGRLRVALELPSNEAVRAAVEAGGGVTVVSELVAAPGLRSGQLVRAPFALPMRDFHLLRHRERYQSMAARAFAALVA
ncbi:LysR family transcriptional regulator [Rhodoplanes sp. TEM]|uniref:LysR family transcriptional regulator n=1 Tax=Rhodoplanes tepidamans TaxID=200616 RepID=A0ABT5J9X0_RHOTP|nr:MULTISPECIES: LysR family transcriptional regulator [Rhodoplanes]MDC7786444.1 LysR family transcriptional regulator [Rhodoplanes tepidamans]MDC7985086.1 LysR family transcriptional regulator [Rhodoplanes sp. TEM]MDQ0357329.1 DNA-binding transcriptional LysR family regulator [Rhodoplanes tepidamans]